MTEPPPIGRVVLVHGFTQTGASWAPIVDELVRLAPELDVHTPDAPGHGSAATRRVDLHGAARDLGEHHGPATYVGYSMGGRIALHLALDRPELVRRLVLIGTTPGIDDPVQRAERRDSDESLARRLEHIGVDAFLAEWLDGPLFATLSDEAAGLEARRSNTVEGLAFALRSLGTGRQTPLWDRLAEIAAPTLVIAGGADTKFAAIGRRMVDALPAGTVLEVPGAGHAVHLERPGVVAAAILDHLRR